MGGNPHNPGGAGLGEVRRVELEARVLRAESHARDTLRAFNVLSASLRDLEAERDRLACRVDQLTAALRFQRFVSESLGQDKNVRRIDAALSGEVDET